MSNAETHDTPASDGKSQPRYGLIPSTPLLLSQTSGATSDVLAETRHAVAEVLHWVMTGAPEDQHLGTDSVGADTGQNVAGQFRDLAVVAAGDDTSVWDSNAPSSVPGLGAPVAGEPVESAQVHEQLPLGLSVARDLLAATQHDGQAARQVSYHSVANRPSADEMNTLAEALRGKNVLFVADGSTRLGPKPPGGTSENAEAYEEQWQQHLARGDWNELATPDWLAAEHEGHLDVAVLAILARCARQHHSIDADAEQQQVEPSQTRHAQNNAVQILQAEHPYGVGYCVAKLGKL